MVLYHAGYITYLSTMIIHRLTINKNQEAVILVSSKGLWSALAKLPNIEELEKYGIFDRVILCDPFSGLSQRNNSEDAIEQQIIKHYDTVLTKNNINLKSMEIITSSDAEGEFKVYLSIKKIPHFHLECNKDMLYITHNNHYKLMDNDKGVIYGNVLRKHWAICSHGDLSTPILFDTSEKSKALYSFKKYDVFNHYNLLNQIENNDRKKILEFYNFNNNPPHNKNTVLFILLNHVHAGKAIKNNPLSKKWHFHLYNDYLISFYAFQIVLDYFVDEKYDIYVKQHPNFPLTIMNGYDCKRLFGEKAVSLGVLPMDFYLFIKDSDSYVYDFILSFGSSAIEKIGTKNNLIDITYDYFSSFFFYASIYTALIFAENNFKENLQYLYYNIKKSQVDNLLVHSLQTESIAKEITDFSTLPQNSFVIIGMIRKNDKIKLVEYMRKIPNSVILCFLSFEEDFFYYAPEFRDFVVPIRIRKEKIKDDTFDPLREENLFIFSKREEFRLTALNFTMEKVLSRVGVKLIVEKLSISYIINNYTLYENEQLRTESKMLLEKIKELSGKMQCIETTLQNIKEMNYAD